MPTIRLDRPGRSWTPGGGLPVIKSTGTVLTTEEWVAVQAAYALGDYKFNLVEVAGPVAVTSDPNAFISMTEAVKLHRRYRKFPKVQLAPDGRLGPISTDFTAVAVNVGIGSIGAYTKAYDAAQLQAVADEGEGNLYTSSIYRYAFGPFTSMPHSTRVMCNGDKFAWYSGNDAGVSGFMLYVDGKPTSLTPYLPTSGVPNWNTITFPSAATREIEIRCTAGIGGLYTSNPYELWKPAKRRGPRVLVIGDSYTTSAGATNCMNAIYWNIGPRIGSDDVWIDMFGGTGYGVTSHADGQSGVQNKYIQRLEPIALLAQTWNVKTVNPDMVVVHGGGANDKFKARSNAQVIADIVTTFTTLRAKLPDAKLVYVEGFAPPGFTPATYNPNYVAITTAVKAALTQIGVYYIDVAITIPWIQGAGYNGTGDATKNSYYYISADTFHPLDVGHLYLRRRIAEKLKTILADDGLLEGTTL